MRTITTKDATEPRRGNEQTLVTRRYDAEKPAELPSPKEWPPPSGLALPSEWTEPLFAFGPEGWTD